MSVKFLHYRDHGHDGKIMSHGGATVAYVVGEEGVSYAVALCTDNDNYNKKYGRDKAQGRLLSANKGRTSTLNREDFIADMDDYFGGLGLSRGK